MILLLPKMVKEEYSFLIKAIWRFYEQSRRTVKVSLGAGTYAVQVIQ